MPCTSFVMLTLTLIMLGWPGVRVVKMVSFWSKGRVTPTQVEQPLQGEVLQKSVQSLLEGPHPPERLHRLARADDVDLAFCLPLSTLPWLQCWYSVEHVFRMRRPEGYWVQGIFFTARWQALTAAGLQFLSRGPLGPLRQKTCGESGCLTCKAFTSGPLIRWKLLTHVFGHQ